MSEAATNFHVLELEFNDIIFTIQDGDGSGRPSKPTVQRKTIRFQDGTYMTVTEYLTVDGDIDYYQYDWWDGHTRLIGIHSEEHDDKRYQTSTEPHHIHPPNVLHNVVRLPNLKHRDLFSVLEAIRFHTLVSGVQVPAPSPAKKDKRQT